MKKRKLLTCFLLCIGIGNCMPVYAADAVFCAGTMLEEGQKPGSNGWEEADALQEAALAFAKNGFRASFTFTPEIEMLKENLNSSVLILRGTGNYQQIGFYAPEKGLLPCAVATGYSDITEIRKGLDLERAGLKTQALNKVKLAVFAGSKTADSTKPEGASLPVIAVEQGAACAIGWKNIVSEADLNDWIACFTEQLWADATIAEAAAFADSFYYEDRNILEYTIVGDASIKIRNTNYDMDAKAHAGLYDLRENGSIVTMPIRGLGEKMEERQTFKITADDGLNFDFQNREYASLISYIQENYDQDFDAKNYDMEVIQRGAVDGYLTFYYKLAGCQVDCRYRFLIENGQAVALQIAGLSIKNLTHKPKEGLPTEEELKNWALEKNNLPEEYYQVLRQEVKQVYRSWRITDPFYYVVFTDYQTLDGGILRKAAYQIPKGD